MRHSIIHRAGAATARLTAVLCLLVVPVTSCGLVTPEGTRIITVDSLTIASSTAPGAYRVRAHGWRGVGGCERELDVVRRVRGDSLVRRFVATFDDRRDAACPAAPFPLNFEEIVTVAPGRMLHYVVQQPDGGTLIREIPPAPASMR
jgi:hypothetical protein